MRHLSTTFLATTLVTVTHGLTEAYRRDLLKPLKRPSKGPPLPPRNEGMAKESPMSMEKINPLYEDGGIYLEKTNPLYGDLPIRSSGTSKHSTANKRHGDSEDEDNHYERIPQVSRAKSNSSPRPRDPPLLPPRGPGMPTQRIPKGILGRMRRRLSRLFKRGKGQESQLAHGEANKIGEEIPKSRIVTHEENPYYKLGEILGANGQLYRRSPISTGESPLGTNEHERSDSDEDGRGIYSLIGEHNAVR